MINQARYRQDYDGEFVIVETRWSAGKKEQKREWVPNPIENQIQKLLYREPVHSKDHQVFFRSHRRLDLAWTESLIRVLEGPQSLLCK